MKNLFAIDINNENERCEFEPFILRRVKKELSEKQNEAINALESHEKKAGLSPWLVAVKYLSGAFFMIVLAAVVKAGKTAFSNAPILILIGAICGVISLALWLTERKKSKTVAESDEFKDDVANADQLAEECLAELNIPTDAKKADIFLRPYKIKNGKEKKAFDMFEYINTEFHVFREGDNLCIADVGSIIGVSIRDMTGIYPIDKRVNFMGWNKEENFNKGAYKPYKMTSNQYGILFIKPCYSLRFSSFSEEYEIIFPAYELETFKNLTELDVKNPERIE